MTMFVIGAAMGLPIGYFGARWLMRRRARRLAELRLENLRINRR